MSEYVEFSAKTVDEAITKALLELGIPSDRLEYEVIEKGSSGILGIFTKPAVIRVKKPKEDEDEIMMESLMSEITGETDAESAAREIKSEKKPESAEKRNTAESRKQTAKADKPAGKTGSRPPQNGNQKSKEQKESKAGNLSEEEKKNKASGSSEEEKGYKAEIFSEEKKESKTDNFSDSKRKHEYEHQGYEVIKEENFPEQADENKETVKKPDPQDIEKMMSRVRDFLTEMFDAMEMKVDIDIGYDEEINGISVNLSGENMGVLIGKRGQTLDSIQYLSSLVANKGHEGYVRIKVDTENYRERREETLENLAKNISYKVRRTKKPVSLEPMNPYERRVIHSALQGDKYVVTRSEGVEPYRHVVISPRNTKNGSKKQEQH